jgi:hypothetical protein
MRDEALASLYILLAGRINEPLTSQRQRTPRKRVKIAPDTYHIEREETETWQQEGLRKQQFEDHGSYAVIRDFAREKRSRGTNEFPLSRKGDFGVFTDSVTLWVEQVPHDEDFIFPKASKDGSKIHWDKTIKARRVGQIIDVLSGGNPYHPNKTSGSFLFPDQPYKKGKIWPHLCKSIGVSAYLRAGLTIEEVHRLTGLTAQNILLYGQPGTDLLAKLEKAA